MAALLGSPRQGATEATVKLVQRTGALGRAPLIGSALLAMVGLAGACGDDDPGGTDGGGAGSVVEKNTVPAAGGIRRQTSSQLQYSLEYLLGSEAAALVEVWDDPQLHGFESIAAAELALSANEVSTLETVVTQAIDQSLLDRSHIAKIAPCVMQNPTPACYDEVATKFGRVAWRRKVEADEQARLVAIANQGYSWAPQWGFDAFETGLKYQLSAILQSPNFIYIVEVGDKDGDYRRLSGAELATRMSFFLVHQTPDVQLLDAADAGELATDDGIKKQARRLLATPEARRSVDRFYSELFLIRDLTNLSKNPTKYPQWNAALARSMQEEMLRFLQDVIWTRNADAREIFTSNNTFVDANLAPIYGVTAPNGGWAPATLKSEHVRPGILGKAGFLARFAHPGMTSPTRRGRFFWEKLMCEEIQPPPPGVDAVLKEDPPSGHVTQKKKLEDHLAQGSNCSSCHLKIDTVGLSMENLDAMGQYRANDEGLPLETYFEYGEWKFASIADLGNLMSADDRATTCIVKNFWRQSMGHLETEGEAAAIEAVSEAFAAGGYKVQDVLVEMTVSPGFKLVAEPK